MEEMLRSLVDSIIREMHLYNSMLVHRQAQDPQCLIQRGKVQGLCGFAKTIGYPVIISTGRVWNNLGSYSDGYACIMFTKCKAELKQMGVFEANNFEDDIYWFMSGNSQLTQYKGKRW